MFEGGFAVATGGMSIIVTNLFRSWFGSRNPCGDFAEEAEELHAARQAAQQQKKDAEVSE